MSKILETYKEQLASGTYANLQKDVLAIIEAGLNVPSPLHSRPLITSRIKTEYSLVKKTEKKGDKYKTISDITDIIGIRIIAYYQDDVNIIKKLLQDVFAKDNRNSIDKRYYVGDSFGYASLHLVMSLTHAPYFYRGEHINTTKYQGLKFEIQLRTILEHAWAEIEHDLGYKHELIAGLPIPIKRGFSRLAAVLETADVEFLRLREQLEAHKIVIKNASDQEDYTSWIIDNKDDPRQVQKFFLTSSLVIRIENDILELTQQTRMNQPGYVRTEHLALMLKYRITNVQQLKDLIEKNEHTIKEIALITFAIPYNYASIKMINGLPKNFLINYVCMYIIATNSESDKEVEEDLNKYMEPDGISLLGSIQMFRSRHK